MPTWEESLLRLFDDPEQQAEGLRLEERTGAVADLATGELAEITLEDRLHGSRGSELTVRLAGGLLVSGRLVRAGRGWILLVQSSGAQSPGSQWLLPLDHVLAVRGLTGRAVVPGARTVLGRLGLGSVLRGLAEGYDDVLVHLRHGDPVAGRLVRVGADHLDLAVPAGLESIPLAGVVAIRSGR